MPRCSSTSAALRRASAHARDVRGELQRRHAPARCHRRGCSMRARCRRHTAAHCGCRWSRACVGACRSGQDRLAPLRRVEAARAASASPGLRPDTSSSSFSWPRGPALMRLGFVASSFSIHRSRAGNRHPTAFNQIDRVASIEDQVASPFTEHPCRASSAPKRLSPGA